MITHLLLLIITSQTSTVLNPEINNSLTILTNYSSDKGNNFSTFFGSLLGLSSLNLPLSGGTLNGTLNGTAATFASSVTTGSDIFLGSGNAVLSLIFQAVGIVLDTIQLIL
jgi:hypothetical protein